jgi:hypothetical protein
LKKLDPGSQMETELSNHLQQRSCLEEARHTRTEGCCKETDGSGEGSGAEGSGSRRWQEPVEVEAGMVEERSAEEKSGFILLAHTMESTASATKKPWKTAATAPATARATARQDTPIAGLKLQLKLLPTKY